MNEQNINSNETMEGELDLFGQFARVEWLLHRYHQHKRRMHGPMGSPHRGQGRVLALLKMQPEISQKELSYLLDMRPQSMGELLVKLEKSGYIIRKQSDEDRRIVNIELTEEGKKVTEERPDYGDIFNCLDKKEQETLNNYLVRIINHVEEQFSGEEQDGKEFVGGPHMREDFGRRRGRGRHEMKLHDMMRQMRDMMYNQSEFPNRSGNCGPSTPPKNQNND